MAIRRFKTSSLTNNLPRYGKMWDQTTDFKFKRAFIVGASTGFYYTEDGTTWTSATYPFPTRSINDGAGYSWCTVLKNGTMFVTGTNSTNDAWLYKSTDGITWTSVTVPRTGGTGDGYFGLYRGAGDYVNRLFVFNAYGSTAGWYSDNDGATWTTNTNNLTNWSYPSVGTTSIINFPYVYNPAYYHYASMATPGTFTASSTVSIAPNYMMGSVYSNGAHYVGGAYGGTSVRPLVRISDASPSSNTTANTTDGNNTTICEASAFGYVYAYAGTYTLAYFADTSASVPTPLSATYRSRKGSYFKGTDGIGRLYLGGSVSTSNMHITSTSPTTLTAITYPIAPTFYLALPDPLNFL